MAGSTGNGVRSYVSVAAGGRAVGGDDFCTGMAGGAAVAGGAPDRGCNEASSVWVGVAGSGGAGSCFGTFCFILRVANAGGVDVAIGVA